MTLTKVFQWFNLSINSGIRAKMLISVWCQKYICLVFKSYPTNGFFIELNWQQNTWLGQSVILSSTSHVMLIFLSSVLYLILSLCCLLYSVVQFYSIAFQKLALKRMANYLFWWMGRIGLFLSPLRSNNKSCLLIKSDLPRRPFVKGHKLFATSLDLP